MSLILTIDTALESASVALARDGQVVVCASNAAQKEHAAWLHPAVDNLLRQSGITLSQLDAVAVSMGPGSYTGLRVGLSAAKGYCYVLGIPLLGVGTLDLIAATARDKARELICPMIDARRMEVYTALFDKTLTKVNNPHACIIDESSFSQLISTHHVLFCGSGCKKLQPFLQHPHADFSYEDIHVDFFAQLAEQYLQHKQFADLAYTEPLYVKEFYSVERKN